jgi:hypothetical protein
LPISRIFGCPNVYHRLCFDETGLRRFYDQAIECMDMRIMITRFSSHKIESLATKRVIQTVKDLIENAQNHKAPK